MLPVYMLPIVSRAVVQQVAARSRRDKPAPLVRPRPVGRNQNAKGFKMKLLGILADAAGYCFLTAFIIMILVGYAHGGKYRMSPWDPALLNEITPTGKNGCLLLLAWAFCQSYSQWLRWF